MRIHFKNILCKMKIGFVKKYFSKKYRANQVLNLLTFFEIGV